MPDLFYLISRWWKQILAVVLLSIITAGVTNYLQRKKYLSVATALPASSYSADKARVFNENIEALYSVLGTSDELDMITGTGQLDTIYLAVTDEYNLFDHYHVSEKGNAARSKAASLLKKNARVMKSEYGELKVKVWDTDEDLAPQLANSIMNKIQQVHSDLQNANNQSTLSGLRAGKIRIRQQLDSLDKPVVPEYMLTEKKNLEDQLLQYDKLIGEYQLMVDSKPLSLLVVEKARKAAWPDKPRFWPVIIVTAFLSLLFGVLLALLLEKRKNPGT
jgi:uncharacterized protein involved in exopolysaccharide biosynthesis